MTPAVDRQQTDVAGFTRVHVKDLSGYSSLGTLIECLANKLVQPGISLWLQLVHLPIPSHPSQNPLPLQKRQDPEPRQMTQGSEKKSKHLHTPFPLQNEQCLIFGGGFVLLILISEM